MSDRPHILIVDDDQAITDLLAERFSYDGFEVTVARSGPDALRRIDGGWPDIVLLDLILPGGTGELIAAGIKKRADIPIVVLSAIDDPTTKAEAIDQYADDYVTKPFDYGELVARVRRVLRRLDERIPSQPLELGPDLTVVLRRREAIVAGASVRLSPVEVRFLAVLAANLGVPVRTAVLLSRVWSDSESADPAYVWVTVRRLRRKLERDPDHPRHLLTDERGGYRLLVTP